MGRAFGNGIFRRLVQRAGLNAFEDYAHQEARKKDPKSDVETGVIVAKASQVLVK